VKIDEADEQVARAPFLTDVADDLLTDALGHNGDGEDDGVDDGGHIRLDIDELVAPPDAVDEDAEELPAYARDAGTEPLDDAEAIVRSQRTSKLRLGDILKEMGLVTDEQLGGALERQK
jgi:hypothetical protein